MVQVVPVEAESSSHAFPLYRSRWLILTTYVVIAATSSFSIGQYAIITDVVSQYYNVAEVWVNWTANVSRVILILFIPPASYLLKRFGIRRSVLIGALLNAISACMKIGAVARNQSILVMISQCLVAVSGCFVYGLPSLLGSVWFGPLEVATACGIGAMSPQIGSALSSIVPPLLIVLQNGSNTTNNTDFTSAKHGMMIINSTNAAISCLAFLAAVLYFPDKPPTPPSQSQLTAESAQKAVSFRRSLFFLFRNRNFLLLTLSQALLLGVYFAFSILFNQFLLPYYHSDTDIGWAGFAGTLTGIMGAVLAGFWLDRTHFYKLTYSLTCVISAGLQFAFTFLTPSGRKDVLFVIASCAGFFLCGTSIPAALEFAAEVSYPISEGTVTNVIIATSQLVGFVYTIAQGYALELSKDSIFICNLISSCILVVGTVLSLFVRSDLRRLRAPISSEPDQ